jgi:hypothetical protein
MPVIWLSRFITVLSAKDLNPLISNDFSLTLLTSVLESGKYKKINPFAGKRYSEPLNCLVEN